MVLLMVGGVQGNSWPEVRLSILVLKGEIPTEAKRTSGGTRKGPPGRILVQMSQGYMVHQLWSTETWVVAWLGQAV